MRTQQLTPIILYAYALFNPTRVGGDRGNTPAAGRWGRELGEDGLQFADKRLATIRVLLSCVVIVTTALPDDHNVDLSRG